MKWKQAYSKEGIKQPAIECGEWNISKAKVGNGYRYCLHKLNEFVMFADDSETLKQRALNDGHI